MGRYVLLMALLLNPDFAFGGLARVEEVPLTPEEVARVASLKEEASSLNEKVAEVAEAEAAILVKGDQGRPCILKPDLQRGWKKLCAVFWKPGESELEEAVKTVTGLFRQSLASILSKEGKEANLEGIEDTTYSHLKHNLGTTQLGWEKRDGPLENESERRGTDVNVKFTFDDSYLGEEEAFEKVGTLRVPEEGPATDFDLGEADFEAYFEGDFDLRETAENRKSNVLPSPVSLPLPRGNKQPVYFEPQPDLLNLKEEEAGKNVFGGGGSDGKPGKHERVGTEGNLEGNLEGSHEQLPGNREDVSQLFWLLTSSTETPTVETTTIQALSTRAMAKPDRTPQEMDFQGAQTPRGILTTTGQSHPQTTARTRTIPAMSPFSLPFLNNRIQPYDERLANSSEEKHQPRQGTDKSSLVLTTSKDTLLDQSTFEIQVESEERGKFEAENEATVPFVTTPSLPIANPQMSEMADEEVSSLSPVDFLKICFFNSTGCDFSLESLRREDNEQKPLRVQSRIESSTPSAFLFTLAPYDTNLAPSIQSSTTDASYTTPGTTSTSSSSIQSSTKAVDSELQRRVQECFLTGKC